MTGRKKKKNKENEKIHFPFLTVEAEQVFVVLWRRGDLDDGDGKAVGGCGEDSRSQRHIVFVQELCTRNL